jgi:hypothetical protein
MVIRIKVNRSEYRAAESNGAVYGKVLSLPIIYVYVELGIEKTYILNPNDDLNTEYRLFIACDIYAASTQEQSDDGDFYAESFDEVVIIYT